MGRVREVGGSSNDRLLAEGEAERLEGEAAGGPAAGSDLELFPCAGHLIADCHRDEQGGVLLRRELRVAARIEAGGALHPWHRHVQVALVVVLEAGRNLLR